MPLQKDFKVKDTLNVGISGLFGDGIRIGEADNYVSTTGAAIDAWGPILSGGRDLSWFIGDGVDTIRESIINGGTVTGDGVSTLEQLCMKANIQSRVLPAGLKDVTDADIISFAQTPKVNAPITIEAENPLEKQGTIQYQTQEDASAIYDVSSKQWVSNNRWTTVEVLGLQGSDSPTFSNLTLSGTGYGNTGTATLSTATEFIIDPQNDNDKLGSVRIKGDFYVDGVTTTINSTNVSLSDNVVQLGYGENQFLDSDIKVPGDGVGIQAGGIANAMLLYKGTDGWEINGNEFTSLVDVKVGAARDLVSISSSTGSVSSQGDLATDGSVTQSESVGSNNKVVTDVFSGKSAAQATWPAPTYIKTFTLTNLNTAKYIVTVGGGANKTAIELLVVGDGTKIDGTAYGQVEIGTEQLKGIEIGVEAGTVGITVSAVQDNTDVTITGTAHYNS